MTIDLDSYNETHRDEETLTHRREALIGQLEWLINEAEVLKPLLAELPEWALEKAPTEERRSVKESIALLHAMDEQVTLTWLAQVQSGAAASFETPETLSLDTESDVSALLDRLRASRSRVVQWFREWDEQRWARSLRVDGQETDFYGLALAITQRDADVLRDVAYRLHEADLGSVERQEEQGNGREGEKGN